jgi:hypothetical protein
MHMTAPFQFLNSVSGSQMHCSNRTGAQAAADARRCVLLALALVLMFKRFAIAAPREKAATRSRSLLDFNDIRASLAISGRTEPPPGFYAMISTANEMKAILEDTHKPTRVVIRPDVALIALEPLVIPPDSSITVDCWGAILDARSANLTQDGTRLTYSFYNCIMLMQFSWSLARAAAASQDWTFHNTNLVVPCEVRLPGAHSAVLRCSSTAVSVQPQSSAAHVCTI